MSWMAPEILETTAQYPHNTESYDYLIMMLCFVTVMKLHSHLYLDLVCSYDERTDVWSLGCILLEMATCGFMDVSSHF